VVQEIADIVNRLSRDMGLTVLLVEQKLPFARRMGDRFAILDRGRLVATGDMPELGEELIREYLTV
jgi:urea transport system ATP-binding protein